MADLLTAREQAIDFLRARHGEIPEGMALEARCFHVQTRAPQRGWFTSFESAADFALAHDADHDCFVGVNLRHPGKGTKDGVAQITCLHADVDFKLWDGDEQAAVQALAEFDLEPSLVVHSGGGVHGYWLLTGPIANVLSLVSFVESLMKRLNYALAPGDDSLDGTHDISRVLRLPGSTNKKAAVGGNAPVRLVHRSDMRYELLDFDKVLPLLPERVPASITNARGGNGTWSIEEVERMLSFIDPVDPFGDGDGYRGWLTVLFGIHSAFPGEDGYELAYRWSNQARVEAGCRGTFDSQPGKWNGIRRSGVSLGTVIKLAREGGWEPPKGPRMVLVPPKSREDGDFLRSFVLSSSNIPAAPFPVSALPGALRDLVIEGAQALDAPPEFIGVPALGFAAGCIGRSRCIELKSGYRQFPILYTSCVGLPGSGKSPGQSLARQAIARLQGEAHQRYAQERAEYEEALQDLKQTPPEKRGRPPVRPQLEHYFTTDTTIEALAGMLTTSVGVVNARDELVAWVKSMDAYRGGKGGDRQRWLSGWSADPWKVDRKGGEPIYVPHPTISVVGGMQPDVLSELRHEAGAQDGFVERMLWSFPDADLPGWTEETVLSETIRDTYHQFAALRASCEDGEPLVVSLDPEAKARFVAWHGANMAQVRQSSGLLRGIYAKLPQQLARLALVLHCLEWGRRADEYRVSLGTMTGAVALVEYFRAHAHRVLPAFGQEPKESPLTERLMALLGESGGWVARSALHDSFNRNLGAGELTEALAQLEEQGRVERRSFSPSGTGRPREEWRARSNEETKKRRNEETPLKRDDEDVAAD